MKIYDYNGKKNICGNRVKEARQKLDITQSDLAARMQVEGVILERDCISRIEIGTRFVTDYEVIVLSKCLQVDPMWLLGYKNKTNETNSNINNNKTMNINDAGKGNNFTIK